jgi:hypothetical protein
MTATMAAPAVAAAGGWYRTRAWGFWTRGPGSTSAGGGEAAADHEAEVRVALRLRRRGHAHRNGQRHAGLRDRSGCRALCALWGAFSPTRTGPGQRPNTGFSTAPAPSSRRWKASAAWKSAATLRRPGGGVPER